MYILGVRIDNLTKKEILKQINYFLSSSKFHQIATVNPEFILKAQKDEEFKNILNSENTLSIADGIGLKFAAWRYGRKLKHRFTGIDLLQEILRIANQNKQKVLVVTHKNSLSNKDEITSTLKKQYPDLEVFCSNQICTSYDIVICNLGAPYQEKLLQQLKNADVKLAIGVGGSFDFLTGKITRAPKWMRLTGLEWLWRLILEPQYRIRKIFNAVVIFPMKIIFSRNLSK